MCAVHELRLACCSYFEFALCSRTELSFISNKKNVFCVLGTKSTDKLYVPGLPEGIRPGAGRIGRQIADEMSELTR